MSCLSGRRLDVSARRRLIPFDRDLPRHFSKSGFVWFVWLGWEEHVHVPEIDELGFDEGFVRPQEGSLLGSLGVGRAGVVEVLPPALLAADATTGRKHGPLRRGDAIDGRSDQLP